MALRPNPECKLSTTFNLLSLYTRYGGGSITRSQWVHFCLGGVVRVMSLLK